jgi:mRNA-degrading endonuclease toxin of MazEF toxin-antitoxin module
MPNSGSSPLAAAVDVNRLGDQLGHTSPEEIWGIDESLTTILGLR